jgi:hypothetical protein
MGWVNVVAGKQSDPQRERVTGRAGKGKRQNGIPDDATEL